MVTKKLLQILQGFLCSCSGQNDDDDTIRYDLEPLSLNDEVEVADIVIAAPPPGVLYCLGTYNSSIVYLTHISSPHCILNNLPDADWNLCRYFKEELYDISVPLEFSCYLVVGKGSYENIVKSSVLIKLLTEN